MHSSEDQEGNKLQKLNLQKAYLTAEFYHDKNPALACHLMSEAESTKRLFGLPNSPHHLLCQFCGCIFRPGNFSARLLPKMKFNKKLDQANKLGGSYYGKLSKYQRKMAKMYSKTTNRLVLKCLVCNHKTQIKGQQRVEKALKKKETPVPSAPLTHKEKKKLKKKEARRSKILQLKNSHGLLTPSPSHGLLTPSPSHDLLTPSPSSSTPSTYKSSTSVRLGSDAPVLSLYDSGISSQTSPLPLLSDSPVVSGNTTSESPKLTSTPQPQPGGVKSFATPKIGVPPSITLSAIPQRSSAESRARLESTSSVHSETSLKSCSSSVSFMSNSGGQIKLRQQLLDNSNISKNKKKQKMKSGGPMHNVLQKMLKNEKDKKNDSSSSSSLSSFLSSL